MPTKAAALRLKKTPSGLTTASLISEKLMSERIAPKRSSTSFILFGLFAVPSSSSILVIPTILAAASNTGGAPDAIAVIVMLSPGFNSVGFRATACRSVSSVASISFGVLLDMLARAIDDSDTRRIRTGLSKSVAGTGLLPLFRISKTTK